MNEFQSVITRFDKKFTIKNVYVQKVGLIKTEKSYETKPKD